MAKKEKENNSRVLQFSTAKPVQYNGTWYPSTDRTIVDENGNTIQGRVFIDANGKQFVLDQNGNPVNVIDRFDLNDVIINGDANNFLNTHRIMSNDVTQINNVPHRKYNQHLRQNAEAGAKAHALWEEEHPNAAAWGYAAGAAPFVVAAAPLAIKAGASAGLGVLSNPIVNGINTALGLGFGVKSAYDLSQGTFTPETALGLTGLAPVFKGFSLVREASKLRNGAYNFQVPENAVTTIMRNGENALQQSENELRTMNRLTARAVTPAPVLPPAVTPAPVLPPAVTQAVTPAPAVTQAVTARAVTPITPTTTTRAALPTTRAASEEATSAYDDYFWDELYANEKAHKGPITTRDGGMRPYTREEVLGWDEGNTTPYTTSEVKDILDPKNPDAKTLHSGRELKTKNSHTGAHGGASFYASGDNGAEALEKAIKAERNPELSNIMADNRGNGSSGLFVGTHSFDTSVDSTPLLWTLMTRNGKNFTPYPTADQYVTSNGFGVRSFFPRSTDPLMKRAMELYDNDENAFKAGTDVFDANHNITGVKFTDTNGEFVVPVNSADQVIGRTNKAIRLFNTKFGTNYPEATWEGSAPYYFGQRMRLPMFFGVLHKNGGKLVKRK